MTPAQTEGLIGMFIVLAILILLVAPAVTGIVRDRRIDRQIKQAQQRRGASRRVARTV
jgi:F0F1-type ATP synthase membrane subunit b/b'